MVVNTTEPAPTPEIISVTNPIDEQILDEIKNQSGLIKVLINSWSLGLPLELRRFLGIGGILLGLYQAVKAWIYMLPVFRKTIGLIDISSPVKRGDFARLKVRVPASNLSIFRYFKLPEWSAVFFYQSKERKEMEIFLPRKQPDEYSIVYWEWQVPRPRSAAQGKGKVRVSSPDGTIREEFEIDIT